MMRTNVIKEDRIVVDLTDNAVEDFLNSLKKTTKATYTSMIKQFLDFTKMSGSEILENKRLDTSYTWEKKILEFRTYLIKKGYSEGYAISSCGAVRGFFSYHRLQLSFRHGEKKVLAEANRKTEDYFFDKEDLTKMMLNANLFQKWVICNKSFGLRAEDFIRLTYGHFRSLKLDSEAPIAIGEYATKKEKVNAYPFLDSDVVPIIKQILEQNVSKKDTDRILTIKETELSVILQTLVKKCNIQHGHKRIRFHSLRKFLIDRLSAVASESQWKQIVGKKINEGAYVSQEQLKEVYTRVMPSITVSNNNGHSKRVEELENEIAVLKATIRELLKDKIEQDAKVITVDGKSYKTVPAAANKWTDLLQKLEGVNNE
jgi:hypothetical protein